jgi:hypothetical protein
VKKVYQKTKAMHMSNFDQAKLFIHMFLLPNFIAKRFKDKKERRLEKIYKTSFDRINSDCDILHMITELAKFKEFLHDFKLEFGESRIHEILDSNKI